MKSGANRVKEFFATRFLEISSTVILVILTVIIFFAIPNLYYAIVVEAILVVTLPALIILSRRTANRNARKDVEKLLSVGQSGSFGLHTIIDRSQIVDITLSLY